MSVPKARMSLTLKPELALKLDNYASLSMIPKSRIINRALEIYLSEREEDIADYKTAVAAWEEFEKSGKKAISSADLRKKFNL